MIHQFHLYAYHLGLRLTLRRESDIQTQVQHLAVYLTPKRGSGIQAWVWYLAVYLVSKRGSGTQTYVWYLGVIWYLGVYLAINVPLIGVYFIKYTSYRQSFYRRISSIDHLIDVPLVGVINVISVHLINIYLRHQVQRSVSILVSVQIEYRHFSAILGSYRYSVYFCQAWFKAKNRLKEALYPTWTT